ncbi:MAG: hypothetical protein JWP85_1991 [Rhodoglobus sp.]|nr:hypothetical protein [Rhodoglobus sp.]
MTLIRSMNPRECERLVAAQFVDDHDLKVGKRPVFQGDLETGIPVEELAQVVPFMRAGESGFHGINRCPPTRNRVPHLTVLASPTKRPRVEPQNVKRWSGVTRSAYREQVKQITYSDSSWLVGDDAADAIIEYAVLLARIESADSVRVAALGANGREQDVTFLIGPATMMTAETTESGLAEPDNSEAIADMHRRMGRITSPPHARPYHLDDIPSADATSFGTDATSFD